MSKTQLPVMEMFYSIQGEGYYTGTPAFFVRLGGCDVGCHWCDVKESWDPNAHPKMENRDIVDTVLEAGAEFVVVTGGEPLMHNLDGLTAAFKAEGIFTALETSGAHPISGDWDWICFSPKKFKAPRPEFYDLAHELKVIVYNRHDLEWAEGFADEMNDEAMMYLQPEWDKRDYATPLILNYIREHTHWSISLQTHKYIGVP